MTRRARRTQADIAHTDRIARLGCLACRKESRLQVPATFHHIRAGLGIAQRNDDWHGIPLCPRHHLATVGRHGEAIEAGKRTWEAKYGTERENLFLVYWILEMENRICDSCNRTHLILWRRGVVQCNCGHLLEPSGEGVCMPEAIRDELVRFEVISDQVQEEDCVCTMD